MNDIAKLLLRLSVGGFMLFHGIGKIMHGIGPIKDMVASTGMPGAMAYGVYVGEVIAPALIVLGLATRPAALVFAFNMLVAVGLAHRGDIFSLSPHGGGGYALELQGLYMFGAIAIALLGAGRFSVSRGRGRLD